MLDLLKDMACGLKNLIVPEFCHYCHDYKEVTEGLCATCHARVIPVVSLESALTAHKKIMVFAATDYKEPLKSLVLKKNYGMPSACTVLGNAIYNYTAVRHLEFDVIVPIPLHWSRYAWRWYNQSELIAKTLSKRTNKPVVNLLTRARRTVFQTGLSKYDREKNLKRTFVLTKEARLYKGKSILLVDDVYTTGTTIHEAAKILFTLVPSSIRVAVACRVV